jgi:hypothetical protein
MGARWVKTAGHSLEGRQKSLIQFDAENNNFYKHGMLLEALHGIGQFLD